jgi:hypothetical protein
MAENPQRRALAAAPWPLHGNIACNHCHRAGHEAKKAAP